MLFIKQCNKLHDILPELFEKTDDYSELLLTISFTDPEGIIHHLINDIEDVDFRINDEMYTDDGKLKLMVRLRLLAGCISIIFQRSTTRL